MASIKRVGKDNLGIPVWEAVYRRTSGGKQIRRRFHAHNKADVERAILVDSQRSDVGLRWSEAAKIYLTAKRAEGKSAASMENVERSANVFIKLMGDISIEDTSAAIFKSFMQSVITQPVKHYKTGKVIRLSGPKVANRHRKELLTIARYIRNYTEKITVIPFENAPRLPAKPGIRSPVPTSKVNAYIDALPPHIRRPVLMVLFYGLRSTATCNLTLSSIDGNELCALDKGDVFRRIPIDGLLSGIISDAMAYRQELAGKPKPPSLADRLFLNAKGKAWNRTSLLHAAQKHWGIALLEKKKIHEIRHTLGTAAGERFPPSVVQAILGHRSPRSAFAYTHPTEKMAADARPKIITELSQTASEMGGFNHKQPEITYSMDGQYSCPCCGRNLLITKKKGRNLK